MTSLWPQRTARRLWFITCSVAALGCAEIAQAQEALPVARAETASSASLLMPDETNLTTTVDAETSLPEQSESVSSAGPVVETRPAALSSIPRRFHYTFGLTLRGIYDDNINVSHSERLSDFYVSINPSVMLAFGDVVQRTENYLRLEYLPSLDLYSKYSSLDAVQQIALLALQYRINRLTLKLSGELQRLDGTYLRVFSDTGSVADQVNVDVSGRTRLNLYALNLGASYDLSAKTFISGRANFSLSDYNNLIGSTVVSGSAFLNYRYSPKLVIGLGGEAGHAVVDEPTPDQTFEGVGMRVVYAASGKLSFTAEAGVEFRQVDQGAQNDFVTPVFEATADYQLFDGTKLSLNASRRTLNSAVLAGEDYNETSLSAGVRQRLAGRFSLGLSVGYQNLDYFNTNAVTNVSRNDNYYSIQPSVDVALTRWWSLGVYYNRRQNESLLETFSFYDNQVAIRSSVTF